MVLGYLKSRWILQTMVALGLGTRIYDLYVGVSKNQGP